MPKQPELEVGIAAFAEERYQRTGHFELLRSTCSAISSRPHVNVGQRFMDYVNQFQKDNIDAKNDAEEIFKLLNDSGVGVNHPTNTAVGYRLHRMADLFGEIIKLPTDKIYLPKNAPVDQPERFGTNITKAQVRFPDIPEKTGNHILDFINELHYIDKMTNAIVLGIDHPLASNADIVYSIETRKLYEKIISDIKLIVKEIKKSIKLSNAIIGKYPMEIQNGANAPATNFNNKDEIELIFDEMRRNIADRHAEKQ